MPRPDIADWGGPTTPLRIASIPMAMAIDRHAATAADRGAMAGRWSQDLWEYAHEHLGFFGWLCCVEVRIRKLSGFRLGLLDLPDRLWRDEYDDRTHPLDAARRAWAEETSGEDDADPDDE